MNKFFAIVLLGLPSLAAAEPGWYMGTGLGYSTIKPTVSLDGIDGYVVTQEKTHDTGFKIFAGYELNSTWAIETQYINLGRASISAFNPRFKSFPVGGTGTVKVDGWAFDLTGRYPAADRFSLLGKIGVIYATAAGDVSYTQGASASGGDCDSGPVPCSLSRSKKQSGWLPIIGLGGQYDVSKEWALRLEYENYGDPRLLVNTHTPATVKFKTAMWTLGIFYRF